MKEKSECDTHLSVKNETSRNENILCQTDQLRSNQNYDNTECHSVDIKLPNKSRLTYKEFRNFWDAVQTKFQHVQVCYISDNLFQQKFILLIKISMLRY